MGSALKLRRNEDLDALVNFVSRLVSQQAGILLGEKQRPMMENRLKGRMLKLGFDHATQYLRYLKSHFHEESEVLVGLLTTHHTFFFREFIHFETILKRLPDLVEAARKQGRRELRFWSAACSRGHEVYSLACFLNFHLPQIAPDFSFRVFGSDIDPASVQFAKNGVFKKRETDGIPMQYLADNWLRGQGEIVDFVKIRKKISEKCQFRPLNLLDVHAAQVPGPFDVIFVRNVLIYFDKLKIQQIGNNLLGCLAPKGLLVCGTSESFSDVELDLDRLEPNFYCRKGSYAERKESSSRSIGELQKPSRLLRVLCVDDSSAMLKVLGKILTPEAGFEVVATAKSGLEAIEKLKHVTVDLMTLDIHMPEMDGLTYLKQQMSDFHPPVVMISSASRSDAESALKALQLGASDFIEKPSLENMDSRGEEIHSKLKTAFWMKKEKVHNISAVDKSMSYRLEVENPEGKVLAIAGSISQTPLIFSFLREMQPLRIPIMVCIEGNDSFLEEIAKKWGGEIEGVKVTALSKSSKPLPGEVGLVSFEAGLAVLKNQPERDRLLTLLNTPSRQICNQVVELGLDLIGLEGGVSDPKLKKLARHLVTTESLVYHAHEYFAKRVP